MGETDLEALLREAGATREELTSDARAHALDLAGTIHDEIGRLHDKLNARRSGIELVSRDPVAMADEIEHLLRDLLSQLETPLVLEDTTIEQITIDNIHPTSVAPFLTIAARAQRGARGETSPTGRSSTCAALNIALNRVGRYVRGVAKILGRPIDDEHPAPTPSSRESDQ